MDNSTTVAITLVGGDVVLTKYSNVSQIFQDEYRTTNKWDVDLGSNCVLLTKGNVLYARGIIINKMHIVSIYPASEDMVAVFKSKLDAELRKK